MLIRKAMIYYLFTKSEASHGDGLPNCYRFSTFFLPALAVSVYLYAFNFKKITNKKFDGVSQCLP